MTFDKAKATEVLKGKWQVTLMGACRDRPGTCLYSCFCPCCMAYSQRTELLEITREPYICFGGLIPCCNDPCNPSCLLAESVFCVSGAILGNRFIVQTRFDRMNTGCDNCILGCTACLALMSRFSRGNSSGDSLAQFIVCAVQGCMLAQQDAEIRYIKQVGYSGVPAHIMEVLPSNSAIHVLAMPPQQQQMVYGEPEQPDVLSPESRSSPMESEPLIKSHKPSRQESQKQSRQESQKSLRQEGFKNEKEVKDEKEESRHLSPNAGDH